MGPPKDYGKRCLRLAEEFLEDSKLSLEHSNLRPAINSAYYAMFHAAQAALALRDITPPKSHKGLRERFGKEIILEGLLERDLGRKLTRTFEMRQKSSYDVYASFGEEGVRRVVEDAERFLEKVKGLH